MKRSARIGTPTASAEVGDRLSGDSSQARKGFSQAVTTAVTTSGSSVATRKQTWRWTSGAIIAASVLLSACGERPPFETDDDDAVTTPDAGMGAGGQGAAGGSQGDDGMGADLPGQSGEEGDDVSPGGATGNDASVPASAPACGDGVIQAGEACDDGTSNVDGVPGACSTDCEVTACTNGATQSCAQSGALGACAAGTQTCQDGQWSECSIQPAEQDTCEVGNDANCDGTPRTDCECAPGTTRACSADGALGNCAKGTQTCGENGTYGPCDVQPADADSCDVPADDANCNGTPNEGCGCDEDAELPCGPDSNTGACEFGVSQCIDGQFSECTGAVLPAARDCSSELDNDCDGEPDNTVDDVCSCTIGETRSCNEHPGLDNQGICRAGMQTCIASTDGTSTTWGECIGSVGPQMNDVCDAVEDSNCDGTPNEGCQCVQGETTTCGDLYGSSGSCGGRTLTCSATGNWPSDASSCQPATGEDCDAPCVEGIWDNPMAIWDQACWAP